MRMPATLASGGDQQIAWLTKTTINGMNRTEGHLSIAEMIKTGAWSEI